MRSYVAVVGPETDTQRIATMAAALRLSTATEEDLLPAGLLRLPEGLSEGQFAARFGSSSDPRYRALVRRIDGAIEQGWRERR